MQSIGHRMEAIWRWPLEMIRTRATILLRSLLAKFLPFPILLVTSFRQLGHHHNQPSNSFELEDSFVTRNGIKSHKLCYQRMSHNHYGDEGELHPYDQQKHSPACVIRYNPSSSLGVFRNRTTHHYGRRLRLKRAALFKGLHKPPIY
jgi:hypothetical protein